MSIKIYVACLASYNNGFLHGKWFDLDKFSDVDELQDAITSEVLESKDNPTTLKYGEKCEEYAIHDFEAPKGADIGEYSGLEELMEMNEMLSDLGEEAFETVLGLKSNMGFDSIEEAKDYYDDNLIGEFKDDAEMAYHIAEEVNCWNLSEGIGRYFDAESFARDLTLGGDVLEVNGTYFWSR